MCAGSAVDSVGLPGDLDTHVTVAGISVMPLPAHTPAARGVARQGRSSH